MTNLNLYYYNYIKNDKFDQHDYFYNRISLKNFFKFNDIDTLTKNKSYYHLLYIYKDNHKYLKYLINKFKDYYLSDELAIYYYNTKKLNKFKYYIKLYEELEYFFKDKDYIKFIIKRLLIR